MLEVGADPGLLTWHAEADEEVREDRRMRIVHGRAKLDGDHGQHGELHCESPGAFITSWLSRTRLNTSRLSSRFEK